MRTLEDKIRAFCVASLDMVADSDRFDFVEDLGAELPMRTIGMLLGIPDADQPSVREHARATLQNDTGGPMPIRKDHYFDGDMFSDYVEWRKRPEWEIDMDNARRSRTSTVRGWDSMPAIVT